MQIRAIDPERDFPAIVELHNCYEKEPITVEQFSQYFHLDVPGRTNRRRVGVDEQGKVCGYSMCIHEKWHADGFFYIWLCVANECQKRGAGDLFFKDLAMFCEANDSTMLTSEIREDFPSALRFAERHGFHIERHLFESTLDLENFDPAPFLAVLQKVEAQGVRFVSLAELGDTQEARRKLYDVNYITALDTPGYDGDWMPFDEFEQRICGADWYRPQGQFGALLGDQWVGMAAVNLNPETHGAYNLMTGVLREYRGRGIAQALKLKTIDYAKNNGAKYIRTHNNSKNAPMLAINRKLGYRPEPGVYEVRKGIHRSSQL